MHVVLVNPPKSHYDVEELAPPLGLLRLARVAQDLGVTVTIEDYNLLWHLDEQLRSSFYEVATERLLGLDGDIYGFTSMAVDSHVALELARRVKAQRPAAVVVLGGTHFSSSAAMIQRAFPWVDRIVLGEGEDAFAALLREHGGHSLLGTPQTEVPRPLYDVVRFPAYFHVNPLRMVNMEAGRGCRYKCSFCYSPGHYHRVRDFGIEDVIAELSLLPALGVRHVWFVEDNFLNDPLRAGRLCRAIAEARLGLTWSCYATFPELSAGIIDALAEAGCTEVFSGIDAVGTASERSFHKAFLRGKTPLEVTTKRLVDAGITPTYAFLVAPPSHPAGVSLGITARTALEARCAGAETLLNPLNVYAGTLAASASEYVFAPDDVQARLMMDVPEVVAENPFAVVHPDLFPFHARYVGRDEWHGFLSLAHCLSTLIATYPQTLSSLMSTRGVDPVVVAQATLERFGDWSRLMSVERRAFEQDAGFFVLETLSEGSPASAVLSRERASQGAPFDESGAVR
jgi:hypothetical protein